MLLTSLYSISQWVSQAVSESSYREGSAVRMGLIFLYLLMQTFRNFRPKKAKKPPCGWLFCIAGVFKRLVYRKRYVRRANQ